MPNSIRPIAILALLTATAVSTVAAWAQPAAPPKAELSTEHISRPVAGLTVTLPVGATASSYDIAGRGVTTVKLPGQTALVNVSETILTKAQTLPEIADSIIRQHLNAVATLDIDPNTPSKATYDAKNARGRLLSRRASTIDGWPAEVFYLTIANLSDDDSAYGYALFMPTSNMVAMLELQTTAPALEQVKPFFELMVSSVVIADPSLADAHRALGVDAGVAFMQSLTPKDYEDVIAELGSEWRYERLYQPAPAGTTRTLSSTATGGRATPWERGPNSRPVPSGDRVGRTTAGRDTWFSRRSGSSTRIR
ncbi:MAG: hypothetical protein IPJ41_07490 [Phycisphaerales bacterium]|nr:hypothetical protein [Phycisphaerales bacterium]